ncbi:hypothetical protein [Millionella massiliensis]|nr:hypothetical protein [Millionella massiliensis]
MKALGTYSTLFTSTDLLTGCVTAATFRCTTTTVTTTTTTPWGV